MVSVGGGVAVLAVLLLGSLSLATAEVVTLTDETFGESVHAADSVWFVKFTMPWCPWSRNMAPAWEQLGADARVRQVGINVGAVNCETEEATCKNERVQGYPTMVMWCNGTKLHQCYADRDVASLKAYALEKQRQHLAKLSAAATATSVRGAADSTAAAQLDPPIFVAAAANYRAEAELDAASVQGAADSVAAAKVDRPSVVAAADTTVNATTTDGGLGELLRRVRFSVGMLLNVLGF